MTQPPSEDVLREPIALTQSRWRLACDLFAADVKNQSRYPLYFIAEHGICSCQTRKALGESARE